MIIHEIIIFSYIDIQGMSTGNKSNYDFKNNQDCVCFGKSSEVRWDNKVYSQGSCKVFSQVQNNKYKYDKL